MTNTGEAVECAIRGDAVYFETAELDVIQKARYTDGGTVLARAAIGGWLHCCEVIHRRCPQLLYEPSPNGINVLHNAAYYGRGDIIKFLLNASAEQEQEAKGIQSEGGEQIRDNKLLMMVSSGNGNALKNAAEAGHLISVKLLVEADPNNKLLMMPDVRGDTPMHYAVKNHHLEVVKFLAEVHPDDFEYSANDTGNTPLSIAWQDALSSSDHQRIAAEIRRFLIEKQPAQCRLTTGTEGWTLIHHAAIKEDLETIKEIIHFWPDCCELVDMKGQNFFHLAVKSKSLDVVNYILEVTNIPDIILNGKDIYGNSPLHIAMSSGIHSIALALLDDPRVNEIAKNIDGKTAFDVASITLLEVLRKSVNQFAIKGDVGFFKATQADVLRKFTNEYGESVLYTVVRNGHLKCCEVISNRCVELLYKTNKNGVSILHEAASNGKDKIIKCLLGALGKGDQQDVEHTENRGEGDKVDYKLLMMVNNNQQTALHFAVDKGHFQSAKILLLADPSNKLLSMVDNKKETVMHYAVKTRNLKIVKLLLEADPDFDYPANDSGHTPLFMSLQEALLGDHISVEIRKLLIQKQPRQCRVRVGTNGWTILHHATFNGDPSAIKEIIQSCPDCADLVENEGRNFLHIATMFEHEKVVKLILGFSSTSDDILNGQDINGDTPLHIATSKGNESIAKLLLYERRVDKMIGNNQGKSALDGVKFDYNKRKAGVLGLIDLVDENELKDQSDFDLLVGALISTVSFTAGITVPGGFNSDGRYKGMAILHKERTFVAFVVFNTIALALSLFAVFIHFCLKHLVDEKEITFQLKVATACSIGSIFAMMLAFIMGSLAVLSTSLSLILIVCGICSIFFVCAFYFLWRMIRQQKHRRTVNRQVKNNKWNSKESI